MEARNTIGDWEVVSKLDDKGRLQVTVKSSSDEDVIRSGNEESESGEVLSSLFTTESIDGAPKAVTPRRSQAEYEGRFIHLVKPAGDLFNRFSSSTVVKDSYGKVVRSFILDNGVALEALFPSMAKPAKWNLTVTLDFTKWPLAKISLREQDLEPEFELELCDIVRRLASGNTLFETGLSALDYRILDLLKAIISAISETSEISFLAIPSPALNSTTSSLSELISGRKLPGIDGEFYQWLEPKETDEGLRCLYVEGDEIDLSTIYFKSIDDARNQIEEDTWGWTPEDAKDYVLVKVTKTLVPNPFQ